MGKKARSKSVLNKCIAFIMSITLLSGVFLATSYANEQEIKTIRVGTFPYAEQLAVDENGNYSGYGYDYLQELARYTGWHYDFVDASWDECLRMLEQGDIDLMGALIPSAEREGVFDFSDYPMISGYGVLATPLDNQTLPYEDFGAFQGLRVGALKSNLHLNTFLRYSQAHGFQTNITEYASQEEMNQALEAKEIDAVILTNLLRSSTMRVVATFGENDGYFATTKGNTAVLEDLNQALREIRLHDPYFNSKLDQKHYNLQAETPISFTRAELDFIENAPPISCAFIPEAHPISYYDKETNSIQGIAPEVCRILGERTGLTFHWMPKMPIEEMIAQMQGGEILLLPAKKHDYIWAEKNKLLLTDPYLPGQMVLLTDDNGTEPKHIALYDEGEGNTFKQALVSS